MPLTVKKESRATHDEAAALDSKVPAKYINLLIYLNVFTSNLLYFPRYRLTERKCYLQLPSQSV